jgi:hypothetical protein
VYVWGHGVEPPEHRADIMGPVYFTSPRQVIEFFCRERGDHLKPVT